MIYAILGDVGSGKSLSAIRTMIRRNRVSFTNFGSKIPSMVRLKKYDIIKEDENEVNWKFWNDAKDKFKTFDIYIDEIHNVFHSRRAMSKMNVAGTKWIAQIRKVFGDSRYSNIYLISQRIERIDKAWRDLLQGVIHCMKIEKGDDVYVMQYHFLSDLKMTAVGKYDRWRMGYKAYNFRTCFKANPYFEMYDSYEVIGGGDYL